MDNVENTAQLVDLIFDPRFLDALKSNVIPRPIRYGEILSLSQLFGVIKQVIEHLRPQCKVYPAYGRHFLYAYGLVDDEPEAGFKIPDEIIGYVLYSAEPATMGGSQPGSSPQVRRPRPVHNALTVDVDYAAQLYYYAIDAYIDFFFFAKDTQGIYELMDWFQELMFSTLSPLLKYLGVEQVHFDSAGFDEYMRSVRPEVVIPIMRYYFRIQRLYVSYQKIIKAILFSLIEEQ